MAECGKMVYLAWVTF